MNSEQRRVNPKEIAIFGMLGALMYASKMIMEVLPNVHLIGVFVIATTVVYRKKALYPIYVFVLLTGLLGGFAMWWIPYLYIWGVLWAVTMLLPKNMENKKATVIYMVVCALHGFLYGTLYAPAQAILFGLDFRGMIDWIIVGLPYDLIHGASNFFSGLLILPLITLLKRLNKEALKTI